MNLQWKVSKFSLDKQKDNRERSEKQRTKTKDGNKIEKEREGEKYFISAKCAQNYVYFSFKARNHICEENRITIASSAFTWIPVNDA